MTVAGTVLGDLARAGDVERSGADHSGPVDPVSSGIVPGECPPPVDEGRISPSDLRAATLSGVRWVSLARVIVEALTITSSVVLARLIPPAEFGRAAIALGFVAIALAIGWVGFGAALVQMQSLEEGDIEAATFLSIATGTALALATIFVLSPVAIEPLFGERVAYLLELASPVFVASGLGTVPNAMLQRRLEFRRLSQIEIVSTVIGPATAIALAAAAGLTGEALVLGGVVSAWTGLALTLLASPLAVPRWRRRGAARVGSFGAYAALATVAGTTFTNIDYAILGARLPAQEVGFYWRGYQVGVEYQRKFSGIMLRLAFPLFSRAGSIEEMRRLRATMVRTQTIVIYPALTTLIALAPELVPLAFGNQWEGAVFPTQILAVAGMASVAVVGSAQITFAVGKPRAVLFFFLVLLGGYAVVVTWASAYGLRTVVIAVAVYQVVLIGAQFYFLESRQVGIPIRETWSAIVPALIASAISFAAAYPIARLLASAETADVLVIFVGGSVALAVYALALRILFPASWHKTIDLARAFLGRSPRTRQEVFSEIAKSG